MSTCREFGLACGRLPAGPSNDICDVPGVRIGHCTLKDGDINTGVTAVLPHGRNLFREKVVAASHVINGFGKSIGLIQIDELGTLETPILLTNTLSVGSCATALVRHALSSNPDIGRTTSTVNPVVAECNDGPLNDIQALAISEEHALQAIESAAASPVVQGSVGAGTGMTCFGYKGGIGSASRRLAFGEATQEAVLNSLLAAEPMVGRGGVARWSLAEALQKDMAKDGWRDLNPPPGPIRQCPHAAFSLTAKRSGAPARPVFRAFPPATTADHGPDRTDPESSP
ncbi:P1 family peptidase [Aquibaculum sediminis]|uniref:P1 family peptidase n=1 Tax=Aquibaculum sediminis TaxID=3231907 RepID=UPI003453A4CD